MAKKSINRKKKVSYSLQDKIEIVKMVHMGSSIALVSRETGIRRATIHDWCADEQITELVLKEVPGMVAEKVEEAIITHGETYIEKVYAVKEKALLRMEALISNCKSLREVTNAFAILAGVQDSEDSPNKGVVANIHNTLVQRIINLHNSKPNGERTIEINGNTKEQEE